jgi:hypothetical protein
MDENDDPGTERLCNAGERMDQPEAKQKQQGEGAVQWMKSVHVVSGLRIQPIARVVSQGRPGGRFELLAIQLQWPAADGTACPRW